MLIYRHTLEKTRYSKIAKYLLTIYEDMYSNTIDIIDIIDFTYRNINYRLIKTRFDSVSILSKVIKNNKKIQIKNVALIGPFEKIKDINILSTTNKTAVIGTYASGKETIAEENYMIEYMGNFVYIEKNEHIWRDKEGKIIIGWHGSYDPPTGM